jgi:hypothetical protein
MNMDARSAQVNTEAGISSSAAPRWRGWSHLVRVRQQLASYKVQLQGDRLGWLSREGGVRLDEPKAPAEPAMPVRVLAQFLGEGVL